MQNGVIRNKLSRIEEYLTKIEDVAPPRYEEYEKDWKTQMIIEMKYE